MGKWIEVHDAERHTIYLNKKYIVSLKKGENTKITTICCQYDVVEPYEEIKKRIIGDKDGD